MKSTKPFILNLKHAIVTLAIVIVFDIVFGLMFGKVFDPAFWAGAFIGTAFVFVFGYLLEKVTNN